MATKDRRSAEADAFVAKVKAPQRAIVEALREMVLEAAPKLKETVKWGAPVYALRGNVVYIAPYAAHVSLGFYRGAEISDSSGLLEGAGKWLRHVKVRSVKEAQASELRVLVRKAVALDRA